MSGPQLVLVKRDDLIQAAAVAEAQGMQYNTLLGSR